MHYRAYFVLFSQNMLLNWSIAYRFCAVRQPLLALSLTLRYCLAVLLSFIRLKNNLLTNALSLADRFNRQHNVMKAL